MTFVDKILAAGFIEQGQKKMSEILPHKERWIPRWWENYDTNTGWLGISIDHPDAWFRKEGEDKELQLSLQGMQTGHPVEEGDLLLMKNRSVRYICLKIKGEKIYETFSGKIPPENIVNLFFRKRGVKTPLLFVNL
jgi:hypothetical protein